MTPKEKAEELVDRFKPHSHFWVHDLGTQKDYNIEQLENAKQCALISSDEVLKLANLMDGGFSFEKEIKYWHEVKKEIELL
jgi:hypothetical protein